MAVSIYGILILGVGTGLLNNNPNEASDSNNITLLLSKAEWI